MKLQHLSFRANNACRLFDNDGKVIWNLTVPLANLPKDFTLVYPCFELRRQPEPNMELLNFLLDKPSSFIFYDLNIALLAERLKTKRIKGRDFLVNLDFSALCLETNRQGIIFGHTTYATLIYALNQFELENLQRASISLAIILGITSKDEIRKIIRARNLSSTI